MKKLVLIIIISIIFPVITFANEKEKVSLVKCVDGDTAIFLINNIETRVRFLAIDTPESVHPTKEVEKYGKNASEYTCKTLTKSKKIELEYDKGSTKTDKYNRTLAWIWVDDKLLQKELINIGYAKVKYIYGKYIYTNELYEAEKIAKEKKLGLWQDQSVNYYTITFNDEEKITKIQVKENETLDEITVVKDGYKFLGWYYNNKKFDFNTRITKDLTLNSKYEKEFSPPELIILIIFIIVLYVLNPKKMKKIIKKRLEIKKYEKRI